MNELHRQYRASDGEQVPSVTTVLSVIGNDFLVKWAGRMGLQGIDPEALAQTSARAGSLAHAAIAAHFTRDAITDDFKADFTVAEKAGAKVAWGNFKVWEARHTIEPVLVEQWLVSDLMRFGGTMDLYASIDGVMTVVDFKTANNVYENHLVQLAAYRALLEEHGHKVEAVRVVALPRDAKRRVVECVETDTMDALAVFLSALGLWRARRVMAMPKLTRL